MTFIMVDGKGNPNDETGEYAKAIEMLYGLSYTIKMSNKSGNARWISLNTLFRHWRVSAGTTKFT